MKLQRASAGRPCSRRLPGSAAKKGCLSFALVPLLLWLPVSAQEQYVSDEIRLGLHESADPASVVTRTLKSGDKLEVLETQGEMTRVRTARGREGWVDSAYLTAKPTAAAQLTALKEEMKAKDKAGEVAGARLDELQKQLKSEQDELKDAKARADRLEAELKAVSSELKSAETVGTKAARRLEANAAKASKVAATLEDAKAKLARVEEQLNQAVAARKSAESEAENAKSQTKAVQTRVSESDAEKRAKLRESELAISQVREQLETAQTARKAAETERDEISRQLDVALNEVARASGPAITAPVPSATLREVQRMAEENQRLKAELGVQAAALRAARDALSAAAQQRQAGTVASSIPVPASTNAPEGGWSRWMSGAWYHHYLRPYLAIMGWQRWQWLLLAAGMLLAAALGAYWVDWGNRRRHGGFRV